MSRRIPSVRQLVISRFSLTAAMRDEQGNSLIECALCLPVLVLLLSGAVNFGRAWYVSLEVASAAEAGALYGVQNSSDISGMKAAALLDAPDLNTLQATATYGTECSDGTSAIPLSASIPSCGVNAVTYVEVTTTVMYAPILALPGFASVYKLSGQSRMRASV